MSASAASSSQATTSNGGDVPPASLWPGILIALCGAIGFSGKAIIIKIAYRDYAIDAVTLLMLRMLVALPFFLVMAWWAGRGQARLSGREKWVVAGLGFSGYYLASMLDFLGLQYISASLERLIMYVTPSIVLLLGMFLLGKKAGLRQWLGIAVSYAGVFLVFGHEISFAGDHLVLGVALCFASVLSNAVYLLCSGETVKKLGALRLTGLASIWACVFCIGQFVLTRSWADFQSIPAGVWQLSLLNGTLCTVVPVLLMMIGIQRLGAALASQVGMIGPLSTIMLGVFLLGEPFNAWIIAGTVLVMGGMWIVVRRA